MEIDFKRYKFKEIAKKMLRKLSQSLWAQQQFQDKYFQFFMQKIIVNYKGDFDCWVVIN